MAARFVLFTLLAFVSANCFGGDADFVPFVIPDDPDGTSLISYPHEGPIGTDSSRIETSGEHFVSDGKRVRIWGVNTSFSGNLPDHDKAQRMAKRLAAAGVNCVRLHHMDTSRWPDGLWDPSTGATLYPAALERLDYYIDQLAQNGIWVNLNLHVGRNHSDYLGLPDTGTDYDKVAGIFTPALITAQKSFASKILNHINAYRGIRYADDPAVAFVEISNEDSFFMWNGDESLRNLPAYYSDILRGFYNEWLLAKYGSTNALQVAWAQMVEPSGDNMLTNGDFQVAGGGGFPASWRLEQHETSSAAGTITQYASVDCLRLNVTNDDGTNWHLQINQGGLEVEAGKYYTLSFDAAASANRSIGISVMQAHDPWQQVGLSFGAELTTGWNSFRRGFTATTDDMNVRVNFSFGGESPSVYLANVQLRAGGQNGLLAGENLTTGNVGMFIDTPSQPRQSDELRFLAETEKAYFDEMKRYVKNTLGCQSLVTGTIVFGPLGLYAQSDMDFIDSHSYWRHPWFPNNPWDSYDWFVEQDAMTDYPGNATLFKIAAERLAGKPFTVTEYNHAAPNDYQAECIPMAATFAALQDWDGFWMYSYAHDAGIIGQDHFRSFFDIANNPAKTGFLRAGAAIFTDGAMGTLGTERVINLSPTGDILGDAVDLRLSYGNDMWNVIKAEGPLNWWDLLSQKCKVSFGPGTPEIGNTRAQLNWTVDSNKGNFSATGRGAWAFTGWAGSFNAATDQRLTVSGPDFAAVTVTTLDGLDFSRSDRFLVTASGRCQNMNMLFSADRRTVNTNWGQAPVMIEAVTGTLKLPPGQWKCKALGYNGTTRHIANVRYENNQGTLYMYPHFATMWYLLERAAATADNLALNKTVEVSSAAGADLQGENAVDGNLTTNWSSQDSDPQYFIVDLGSKLSFNTVRLHWQDAYAVNFQIQTSDDKVNWSTLVDEQNGLGGIDEYTAYANAQYVRLYAAQRASASGYSLSEIEIYECDCFDINDFSAFARHWQKTFLYQYSRRDGTDTDNDNDVDFNDLANFLLRWLSPNCFGL